jgi:hypothetical protein
MANSAMAKQNVEGRLVRATDNPVFRVLARAGFAASGLIQLLVGWIAIQVALQHSNTRADQSGALSDVAKSPGGIVLLWIAAIGALALALWLVISGVLHHDPDRKARWGSRVRDWGKAVLYLAIGLTALRFAMGGTSNSARSSRKGTATVLALPGGPVLLGILGLAVVALGIYLVVYGIRRKFVRGINVPSGRAGQVTVTLGRIGYAARGVAIGAVGVLFVVAAFTQDAQKSTGLDGALKGFVQLPFGRVVLILIGIGWIASGIYTFIRAKQARLD